MNNENMIVIATRTADWKDAKVKNQKKNFRKE